MIHKLLHGVQLYRVGTEPEMKTARKCVEGSLRAGQRRSVAGGGALRTIAAGGSGAAFGRASARTAGATRAVSLGSTVVLPLAFGAATRLPFRTLLRATFGLPFRAAFGAPGRLPFGALLRATLGLPFAAAGRLAFALPFRLVPGAGLAFATGTARRRAPVSVAGTLAEATLRLALGFQTGDFVHGDAAPDEMLDAADLVAFGVRREGVGLAVATGTAGAADPVNIVFSLHGQVVVEGVADALHVNSAGGHVGGHQNAQLATLQQTQGAGALTLVHVAM